MRSPILLLLLILLCFGVSSAQADNPDWISKNLPSFLEQFQGALATRDEDKIGKFFSSKFEFQDCSRLMRRDEVITFLTRIPPTNNISIHLKEGSISLSLNNMIKFVAQATGRPNLVVVAFYDSLTNSIKSGLNLSCKKIDFLANKNYFVNSSKSVDDYVREFQNKWTKAISSKSRSIIGTLLRPDFNHDNCRRRGDQKDFIDSLLKSGRDYSLTIKTAKDIGSSIQLVASLTGVDVEFYLNKRHLQLESGELTTCENYGQFTGFPKPEVFVRLIKKPVDARDYIDMERFFSDDFEFVTCQGTYNKTEFVYGIASIPMETKITGVIKSSKMVGNSMEISGSITGLDANTIDVDMFVKKGLGLQVRSGRITSCPQKRRFNSANPPNRLAKSFF